MDQRRIIHITSVHKCLDSRIFHKEISVLRKAGFAITLICPNCHNEDITEPDINIEHIPCFNNKIIRMFLSPVLILIRCISKPSAVFHFHDPEQMITGLILTLLGRKVIYDIHENVRGMIVSRKWLKTRLLKAFISQAVYMMDRIIVRAYSGIIVARPDIAEFYQNLNMIIFRNFPSVKYMKKVNQYRENKKKVVIYAGGLTAIRGIKQLIMAFDNMGDKAELWLMGPWLEKNLQKECEHLPGYQYVRYLGSKPYGEHFEYIRKADFGIIPFLPGPNHNTTLPNKPFEYALCDCVLLMSDFDYWKDIFDDMGFFFNPLDPDSIALSINSAIDNPDLCEHYRTKAFRKIRDEYNLENEGHKLIEFYNDILSK